MVEAVGVTSAPDSVTAVTEYSYENGKVKAVTDPEDGVSSYTYDNRGNIQAVTDPMGNVTQYAYDSMNRVKTVTNALNVVTSYTYNSDGLLEEEVNGREQKRNYKYDALGRVIEIKDEAGTISYTYDANGNVLTVKDKQGTIKRTYDALNRVKTYTDYNGNTITYGYDEMGNRISLTYPGGEIVRYTYDKCGNLKTVTDAKGRVTKYTYTKNGKVKSITRPDGSCESYEYDNAGRVVEATDKKGEQLIHHYQYTYDLQGNITNIEKHGTEEGKSDLSAVTNTTMTYTADNRLDTFNGQKVNYDADGNMTYGPLNGVMTEFTYDCRNRLIKAGDTTYEYDAENTRIAIQTKEKREEYVVDKNTTYSQVLSITTYEKNLLGQFTKEKDSTIYTYGIGLISQERTAKGDDNEEATGSGEYYLYHYNQIGSTTQLTDMEGKVVYTYTYSAYGERTGTYDADGNIIDDNSTKVRFLYNGQAGVETDENGLYYMRARYYNTDIKRFINRDIVDGTIQNSQSLNKYSYVQGNPISLTDPFGLCPEGGGILDYLKQNGHTILDALGLVPGIGVIADTINAIWYYREGNTQMAIISAIAVLPFAGDIAAGILKGAAYATKSCKLLKSSMVVKNACRLVGATAQTGVNISNTQSAAYSLYEEYKQTGSVSWQNVGSFMMSSVAAVAGTKATIGNAKSLKAVGTQKITPVGEWGCFIAGTPVKTEDGQKNIEEIKAGERVYAKNTETGEEGYKEVVRVFVKDVNKLVHLQIGETKIDTTTNHPFWVVGYGFKEAGDLGAGEKVLTATGEIKIITSVEVEELETPVTVYNFEVKDWHTYYVSELEVLVHNMCKVAGKTKAAGETSYGKLSGNAYQSGSKTIVNRKGVAYPEVMDIRTGQNMVFPEGVGSRVPKDSRVGWYRNQSEANLYRVNDTDILCKKDYIDEWYRRGYQTPEGGWDLYEIHHIKPREFGGSADFENMVPLLKDVHRKVVTPWWSGYGQ